MIHNRNPAGSLRLLLHAIGIWFLAALVLLTVSAFLLSRIPVGSAVLGYWSSALSFLSAFFAGLKAGDRRQDGSIAACLSAGLLLSILLLTTGFLFGGGLDPSGILSVVSFTFAGVLLGGLAAGRRRLGRKASAFRFRRG